ncbi:nuclear receptor 2C2-associated protein-like protein [Neocallimastix californiae]|uniref:Nuclear receptor 2C2-associated protein-like protein n=1 Tax=Neocallimastix californiae TaxID=1754190 RepID=A0A1Y2E9B1_9FUNG|nr:nuclear receptor 2C2-associated protein-like protein [Neocallimastix californiae]|eukprot:ORY68161.1 nuclear receptor 2C2-associated protein-like protein [Neocallimastix californiae]
MTSLIELHEPIIKVSSTYQRDVKNFGKQFMTDNDDETCWNSDQGSPQSILINFEENEVCPKTLLCMFQGGFAGKECEIKGFINDSWETITEFFPEDSNTLQIFPLNVTEPCSKFKIVFKTSTDFYGRIIIYKLDLQE